MLLLGPLAVALGACQSLPGSGAVSPKLERMLASGELRAGLSGVTITPARNARVAFAGPFIPYRDATWRVVGASPTQLQQRFRGRTLATSRGFRPLSDRERSSVEAMHLRLATAREGEDIAALSQRTGNAWDASTTAVYNGVFVNHRFRSSDVVKIAVIEPYVPRPR
jgi:predicted Zn-dependent protease